MLVSMTLKMYWSCHIYLFKVLKDVKWAKTIEKLTDAWLVFDQWLWKSTDLVSIYLLKVLKDVKWAKTIEKLTDAGLVFDQEVVGKLW